MSVSLTYGDYSFSPVPILNYKVDFIRNEIGDIVGKTYSGTLSSYLLSVAVCNEIGGSIDTLIAQQQELVDAFDCTKCQRLLLVCDGETLLDIYPRITDISFAETPDNWTQSVKYDISLAWDVYLEAMPPSGSGDYSCFDTPYISSVNEVWSVELSDNGFFVSNADNTITTDAGPDVIIGSNTGEISCFENMGVWQFTVTHELAAKGRKICIGTTGESTDPIEEAMKWINSRLGFDSTCLEFYGISGDAYSLTSYNSTKTSNLTTGEVSVKEAWLVLANPSGEALNYKGLATEDYNIDVQTSNSECTVSITVSGTINGLEQIEFVRPSGELPYYNITSTKIDNASTYWNNIKPLLFCRAQKVSPCTLNIIPVSSSVGVNDRTGVITYSITYNNRPSKLITGSRYESITIDDSNPSDVFAEKQIPGRARGNVLQPLKTVTTPTRTVTIEVIMGQTCTGESSGELCTNFTTARYTSPKSLIEPILCCLEDELTNANEIVFKTQDNETWNISTCRYSRTVSWAYQSCTGPAPVTSFCPTGE